MRVYVWQRVGPRRKLLIEALPGLIIVISSLSVVTVHAMQRLLIAPNTSASASATLEEQTALKALNNAEIAKKNANTSATNKTTVKNASDPLAKIIGSDPATAEEVVQVSRQMWFISTPTSDANAKALAQDAATKLKQLATNGTGSLAIMEPTNLSGGFVDFNTYKNGGYDSFLATFYTELKNRGITDATMGVWAMLPEANMPEWGMSDPAVVSACIIRTAKAQKMIFPDSLVSLMLNGQTYPGNDTQYAHGEYKSLLPYVQSIPKGLVDSFGYQGFPWAPPANQPGSSDLDPSNYLRANLAIEAARSLGVHSIWLNSGSPKRMYTNEPAQTISFNTTTRTQILNGVFNQAKLIKDQGFGIAVNIFAGDKSASAEAKDWSYPAGPDKQVFDNFSIQLKQNGMSLWQYNGN